MVPQLGFRVYRVHEELGFLWGMRGSQLGFRVYRVYGELEFVFGNERITADV